MFTTMLKKDYSVASHYVGKQIWQKNNYFQFNFISFYFADFMANNSNTVGKINMAKLLQCIKHFET